MSRVEHDLVSEGCLLATASAIKDNQIRSRCCPRSRKHPSECGCADCRYHWLDWKATGRRVLNDSES